MRFVAGRDFAASDAADPRAVAVVNETLARRFFPGQPAVGQVLRAAGSTVQPGGAMTVVGVVNDSIYNSARGGVRPTLYRFVPTMTVIVVRAANGDPTSIVRNVTEAVTGANAGVFVSTRLLRDQADATTARERLVAMVSGVFGGLAVALAGVGLYGLVSYSVGRRRREIGVRRALGAPAGSIVRLIIGHAAALLVAGAIMGLFLCLLSLRFVSPLLYDLQPLDPGTLLGAAGTLVSVGLFAAWLPTCRALRIHPAEVLRE
jgi:ABC-type antimicrobial peptide transport system permease subunit